jgi:hypothetical protein
MVTAPMNQLTGAVKTFAAYNNHSYSGRLMRNSSTTAYLRSRFTWRSSQ